MSAYYNEFDPKAAAWLRELIKQGLIAPGDVDERSIEDVAPDDLKGYTQVHLFAGIGGWSYALRLAGWEDDRTVWTGSCPCQPFSAAGKGKGVADERHLWPAFYWLISQCAPPVVFGEQVASKDGRAWLAGVQADLEELGYRTAGADLCAAGIGAPHIRQRLWWVADSEERRRGEVDQIPRGRAEGSAPEGSERLEHGGSISGLGDSGRAGARRDGGAVPRPQAESERGRQEPRGERDSALDASADRRIRDTDDTGSQGWRVLPERPDERSPWEASLARWVPCADGKARRLEPGLEPLVDGLPGRVGLLRGYGNAIVPQVAETFVRMYTQCTSQ